MSAQGVTTERFLVSCIMHSNNGTVDFQTVANECGIVSRAAAAIKYKRLKDKYCTGDADAKKNVQASDSQAPQKAKKASASTKPRNTKKRKLEEVAKDDEVAIKDEVNEEDT